MSELNERVAVAETKIVALHKRLDDDIEVVKNGLEEIGKDVKSLLAWKNRVAGMMAAATLIGTFLGWAISLFIGKGG